MSVFVKYLTLAALIGYSPEVVSQAAFDVQKWVNRRDLTSPPLPRGFLSTNELIVKEGYRTESYRVTTEDGYQLKLTRIVNGRKKPGIPVLFVHGIAVCSDIFLTRGKGKDLAFILADLGYDVWFGDQRGNYYSRKHVLYSPKEPNFWDFSIHECGHYDLPSFIDAIIQITGYSKIFYVGHSMGATVFLVMGSSRPEYSDKILTAILLAPVAFTYPLSAVVNPVNRFVLVQYDNLQRALDHGRVHELVPRSASVIKYIRTTCNRPPSQDYCLDFAGSFYGEHRQNINRTTFADFFSYTPAGTSSKTVHHFSQIFKKGFQQYDYGLTGNMVKYNSATPPVYNVSLIRAPTAIFYGLNDALTFTEGMLKLGSLLPKAVLKQVADTKYNHIDFVIGLNTMEMVYGEVINLFKAQIQKSDD